MYIHIIMYIYICIYYAISKLKRIIFKANSDWNSSTSPSCTPSSSCILFFQEKKTQFSFLWVHHERERLFLVAKLARRKHRGAAIDSIDQPSWMDPKQKRFVIRRGVLPNMGMPDQNFLQGPKDSFPWPIQLRIKNNPTPDHPPPPPLGTSYLCLAICSLGAPKFHEIQSWKLARIATLLGRKLWTMWNQWCANESRIQQSEALVEICMFPPALRRENIPWIKMGPAERIWDWLSWDTSAFLQMFCAAHPARLIAGSISFVPLPREQRFYWKLQFTPI